jgi:hypothetical protein
MTGKSSARIASASWYFAIAASPLSVAASATAASKSGLE